MPIRLQQAGDQLVLLLYPDRRIGCRGVSTGLALVRPGCPPGQRIGHVIDDDQHLLGRAVLIVRSLRIAGHLQRAAALLDQRLGDGERLQAGRAAGAEGAVDHLAQLTVGDTPGDVDQVVTDGGAVDPEQAAGDAVNRLDVVASIDHHHADREVADEAILAAGGRGLLPG